AASSEGSCEVIARPEDVANIQPAPAVQTPTSSLPAPPIAVPAGVQHLLCTKPQQLDAPIFSLELINGPTGNVSEIHLPNDFKTRRYRVTTSSPSTYAAEELGPEAPDAAGSLFLDRVTGNLTTTNRISFAAVEVLVKQCDGQLKTGECEARMKMMGGNPFACFLPLENCPRWRAKTNESNVLAIHYDTCKRAEKKF